MDYFNLLVTALIGAIVWTIFRAVRRTQARIDHSLRGTDPRQRTGFMLKLAKEVRAQAEATCCPRCEGPTFAMLDRDGWWKCDVCSWEFEGPAHLPTPEGAAESGRPTGA